MNSILKTIMNSSACLVFILGFSSQVASAQTYCIPGVDSGCSGGDEVASFVLQGENNTGISQLNSACAASAYDDQSSLTPVDLYTNQSYNATISSGYYDPADGDRCAIWIDFDNNGVFSAAERVVTYNDFVLDGPGSQIPIPIPVAAALGVHRMRVMVAYPRDFQASAYLTAAQFDPCNNRTGTPYKCTYGETHDFRVNIISQPLPVLMSNLSGTLLAGNKAALSWNTFTEQNNKGFEIQRAENGRDFKTIGFVGSKAKSGNSSQSIPYSFNDADAVQDVAYYRLRQTDLDGKTTYSNILRLAASVASGFDVMVAPNPVKSNLVINTYGERSANATIYISDMTGKLIRTLPVTAAETLLDMSGLASGLYLVKYSDANYKRTIKVSKE